MKWRNKMKKSIEIFFLIIIGMAYLCMISGLALTIDEASVILEAILDLVRLVIRICCMIMILNTLKTSDSYRARFMAISACLLGGLILVRMGLNSTNMLSEVRYLYRMNSNYLNRIGEVICVYICVKYIDEQSQPEKWALVIGSILLVSFPLINMLTKQCINAQGKIDFTSIKCIFAIVYGLCIMSAILTCRAMTKKLHANEKRFFFYLLFIKQIEFFVLACNIRHGEIYTFLVQSFVGCICSVLLLLFVDGVTYGRAWQQFDLDLKEKEGKVLLGIKDQKRLAIASVEIQDKISQITENIECLEAQITEKYDGKDLAYLQKIKKNCRRLYTMSNQIVVFSAFEGEQVSEGTLEFKEVNLSDFIADILTSIEPYTNEKHIHVDYVASSDEICAQVNAESIERIVINLVSNAVKYNKPNGQISIHLSKKKDMVYLAVRDTGVGMTEEDAVQAFERFNRGKQRTETIQEGSGLGLTIVKALVSMHKGKINVASKLNVGTIISVSFPDKQIEM